MFSKVLGNKHGTYKIEMINVSNNYLYLGYENEIAGESNFNSISYNQVIFFSNKSVRNASIILFLQNNMYMYTAG